MTGRAADAIHQGGYDACLAHSANALWNGPPFETAPEDDLATLALMEAAYAASAPSTRP